MTVIRHFSYFLLQYTLLVIYILLILDIEFRGDNRESKNFVIGNNGLQYY